VVKHLWSDHLEHVQHNTLGKHERDQCHHW
jgi:hypothetical protein